MAVACVVVLFCSFDLQLGREQRAVGHGGPGPGGEVDGVGEGHLRCGSSLGAAVGVFAQLAGPVGGGQAADDAGAESVMPVPDFLPGAPVVVVGFAVRAAQPSQFLDRGGVP